MSEETILAPIIQAQVEIIVPPVEEAAVPPEAVTREDAEQVRAAELAFTRQQQEEAETVAGMLGMWTGTLLLHELARDHFRTSEEEEEEEPGKKKPRKPEDRSHP